MLADEKVRYQSGLGRDNDDHRVPLRVPGRSLSYKRLQAFRPQGAFARQWTVKYLYGKVMPILELARCNLWKSFGLKAVMSIDGVDHIPELVNVTLRKISTLTPTLELTQLLDNCWLAGRASLTFRGSGCATASMHCHIQAYDGGYSISYVAT